MRNKEYKTNNDVNKNIIRITENELKQIVTESVKKVLTELDWRTYDSAGENISANDIFADIKNSIFDLENTGELNVAVLKNNHIVPTKHDYIHAYFKNENELIVEYNGITKSIPCNISKLENNQEYVARCIMQGFAQIYLKK